MKVTHPRFGEVEVLEESALFYRIEHPSHGYLMWFPKSDLAAAPEPKPKEPKKARKPGKPREAKGETIDVVMEFSAPPRGVAAACEEGFEHLASLAENALSHRILKGESLWACVVEFGEPADAAKFTALVQEQMGKPSKPVTVSVKPLVN
jgi:hypothetical protein